MMKSNMGRACLGQLLFSLLLAVVAGLFVYHRVASIGAAIGGGLLGGIFLSMPFGYAARVWTRARQWWLIVRASRGAEPRDGSRTAIIGTIRPVRETLLSPFTQTRCVAYRYEVRERDTETVTFQGFAMVPASIQNIDQQIRLLAYPELDVTPSYPEDEAARRNAEEFIANTQFTITDRRPIREAVAQLNALLADDDGRMRSDERRWAEGSPDAGRLVEWVVPVGATVCAIGRYSATKRALVPDPKQILHAATIRTGQPGTFARGKLASVFSAVIGIVISSILVLAASVAFLTAFPLDAAEQRNPARLLLWPEVRAERWIEDEVRMRLRGFGLLDSGVMTMVQLCDECAIGTLQIGSKQLRLAHATAEESGDAWIIRLTSIPGGVDGVTLTFGGDDRPSSLLITFGGGPIDVPPSWLRPDEVQTTQGTLQDPIYGRVTLIAPDDSIRFRASFSAVVRAALHPDTDEPDYLY